MSKIKNVKKTHDHNIVANQLLDFYDDKNINMFDKDKQVPSLKEVSKLIELLLKAVFPSYYNRDLQNKEEAKLYVKNILDDIRINLETQIKLAILFCKDGDCDQDDVNDICTCFIDSILDIQKALLQDVMMIYKGDPAATSLEEIILSYPGFFAIFVYRFAHVLYQLNVPIIPRMMTERAHSNTGIDINPGAKIGKYFFIDHGTGIVIGETAVIGNRVKLYQGVTLGALSTRDGQKLAGVKRHPTLMDNVTIYANATVLGGDTIIGENVVIGGNAFITRSIAANTKVSMEQPKLKFKTNKSEKMM